MKPIGAWNSFAGAVLLAAAQSVFGSAITDSAHDFRTKQWTGGHLCVFCHTPHRAGAAAPQAPSWTPESPAQVYTLYGSAARHATRHLPGRDSKLCLSCHDGAIGSDRSAAATGASRTPALKDLGNTLLNHHPVGLAYNRVLVTPYGSLFDPGVKTVTMGLDEQARTGTVASLLLTGGRMECSSCHDVHNTFTASTRALLRVTAGGREICLACHDK